MHPKPCSHLSSHFQQISSRLLKSFLKSHFLGRFWSKEGSFVDLQVFGYFLLREWLRGNKNMEEAVMGVRGLEVTGYTSDQDRINQSRNISFH